jgi:microcystin-dependent protein
MPISQNTALFSLLGTYYGGNGTSTFALPNLQGAMPLCYGQGAGLSLYDIGQTGGSTSVTLLQNQIPLHTHAVYCAAAAGNSTIPTGRAFAAGGRGKPPAYAAASSVKVNMSPAAVGIAGGSAAHENMQPYLTLNFCIALQGIFPTRS